MSKVCTLSAGHQQSCGEWVDIDDWVSNTARGLCLKEMIPAGLVENRLYFLGAAQYLTSKGYKITRLRSWATPSGEATLTYSIITPQQVISYSDREGIMTLAQLAYRRDLALQ